MKKIVVIVLIFLAGQNVFGQSGNLFPLHTGDKFYYQAYTNGQPTVIVTLTIGASQEHNGKTYYFHPVWNLYVRYDTASTILFVYDESATCFFRERPIDSLGAGLNDSIKHCMNPRSKCTYKQQVTMFGTTAWKVTFSTEVTGGGPPQYGAATYFLGYGLATYGYGSGHTAYRYDLIGGIINGAGFGYQVGMEETLQSNISENYSLSQNYPNPFNPTTKINYEIKSSAFVSMKVFDILGKEVAALVNEKQNAGSYAVDFNSAEFNLPSGIYFYTLKAGEFKETKKMVLLK